MKPKFTPGPWFRFRLQNIAGISIGSVETTVTVIPENDLAQSDANARLIAAAPEMFEFLKQAWSVCAEHESMESWRKSIIAKATGEE